VGGCNWAGFIWFYDEHGKEVGSRTKFTLQSGQSAHGDLDGVIGPPDDQYGRKQVRPVAIIGPPDSQPGAQTSGHCAALVGASLEVFDKQTGGTVAAVDSFFIAPVDRAEPPPSPIVEGKK